MARSYLVTFKDNRDCPDAQNLLSGIQDGWGFPLKWEADPSQVTVAEYSDDAAVVSACRAAAATPCKFGHSDVGDYFVRYLAGQKSSSELLTFLRLEFGVGAIGGGES